MVDANSFEDAARMVGGKIRDVLGGLAGDAGARARAGAEQATGTAQDTFGDAMGTAGEWRDTVVSFTRDKPVMALVAALSAGFVLRAMMQTRRR